MLSVALVEWLDLPCELEFPVEKSQNIFKLIHQVLYFQTHIYLTGSGGRLPGTFYVLETPCGRRRSMTTRFL